MHRRFTRAALVSLALVVAGPATAGAAPKNTSVDNLTSAVTVAGIQEHLNAFQAHADANGGNRYAGLPGHDASAQYVYDRAEAAGYDVRFQEFEYTTGQDLSVLSTAGQHVRHQPGLLGRPRGARGHLTNTPLVAVDLVIPPVGGSTSGCEADDFDGFPTGAIALVQRGSCDFIVKVNNAAAADASAIIIFNEGNAPDRTNLDFDPIVAGATIPVLAASFPTGEDAGQRRHRRPDRPEHQPHERLLLRDPDDAQRHRREPGRRRRQHDRRRRASGQRRRGAGHQRQRLRLGGDPRDRRADGERQHGATTCASSGSAPRSRA